LLKLVNDSITAKQSIISAFIIHGIVEIPYFIFPVIVLVVGKDLELGSFMWIGLGSLGTIAALSVGLPSPIFGWLVDRYRRGVMMFFSLILAGLGSLLIGLYGEIFLILALGIALVGLGVSLYHPAGLSWVTSAYENADKNSNSSYFNRILGLHGVGGTIGSSIAPISVYFLIDVISWRQIYFLWSFPFFIIAIGFWVLIGRHEHSIKYSPRIRQEFPVNEKIDNETSIRKKYGSHLRLFLIFTFISLMSLSWGMVSFILSPFLSEEKHFKISEAALFIGVTHLIAASGQLIGGYLGDKYGEKISLSFAASLQIIVLFGLYFITNSVLIFILYILIHIVNTIFWPSTNSLLARSTIHRGSAFGGFMLVVNIVRSFGPTIDGLIISVFPSGSYLIIFSIVCVLSVGSLVTLYLIHKYEISNRKTINKSI
jgi:MFS family permease